MIILPPGWQLFRWCQFWHLVYLYSKWKLATPAEDIISTEYQPKLDWCVLVNWPLLSPSRSQSVGLVQHLQSSNIWKSTLMLCISFYFTGFSLPERFLQLSTILKLSSYLPLCLPALSPLSTHLSGLYIFLVLATGPGNLPAVWIWTTAIGWFSSRPVQKPDPLSLGGANLDTYLSTNGFCSVWLDLLYRISGFVFRVSLFIVAFRYATNKCKIFTLVGSWLFWMYWPPFLTMEEARCFLPHPENKRPQSVNDCCSCFLSNISGTWSQTSIDKKTATFIGQSVQDISAKSSQTITTYLIYRATTECCSAYWPTKPVETTYIDNNDHIVPWLTMMQGRQSLTLPWCSFSRWSREHVIVFFSYKVGQYFVYDCLQPVTT